LVTKKEFIDIKDLPSYLRDTSILKQSESLIDKESFSSLEDLEKDYITYLINQTDHNIKKTAQILNISRTTLYSKLKKYEIPH